MRWSNRTFVSKFLPIGRKRETNGNETGNEEETKRSILCKIGNEPKTGNGNESGVFKGASVSISFPGQRWSKEERSCNGSPGTR